jgi:hypothetical protein
MDNDHIGKVGNIEYRVDKLQENGIDVIKEIEHALLKDQTNENHSTEG